MAQDNHVIGSGLTEQQLGLASFWVRHGQTLKQIGYGSLIGASVVLWAFVVWSLLDALIISYPRESRIPLHIVQTQLSPEALQATGPRPVNTGEVSVFQNTADRQDFLVEITNPNPMWWAEFTYRFDAEGELTSARKGFILPQSQRYLTELGWKGKARARTAQLRVDDIVWHRINPDQVEGDYTAFAAKRLQLQFDDVAYKNDLKLDNQTIGQTFFTLRNPTAYGFWNMDLTIVLYRLDTPVAVTTITESEIKPGESRPITINWFENLPSISKTEIRPSVNLLDPSVYLPTSRF